MFPSPDEPAHTHKKIRKKTCIVVLSIICGLVLAVGFFGLRLANSPKLVLPDAITKDVKSTIYLPQKLPGNYELDKDSFVLVENNTVLIFAAGDEAGGKLHFSEQPKPPDFDFNKFYKDRLKDAKTLDNVPYSSVWGQTSDGRLMLSIVTENTWIVMATSAPLNASSMQHIAQDIRRY